MEYLFLIIFIYLFGCGVSDYIGDYFNLDSVDGGLLLVFWPIAWIPILGYHLAKQICKYWFILIK